MIERLGRYHRVYGAHYGTFNWFDNYQQCFELQTRCEEHIRAHPFCCVADVYRSCRYLRVRHARKHAKGRKQKTVFRSPRGRLIDVGKPLIYALVAESIAEGFVIARKEGTKKILWFHSWKTDADTEWRANRQALRRRKITKRWRARNNQKQEGIMATPYRRTHG